jgi:hypothetical protein
MGNARSIVLLVFLLCTAHSSGCSGSETTTLTYKSEVEIAPDRWLILERKSDVYASDLEAKKNPHQLTALDAVKQFANHMATSGTELKKLESEFAFDWKGKRVAWKGKDVPITLREHKGSLYMVGFNREDVHQCRFTFFKLNDKGNGFEMITPNTFPRQIATQNMWLNARSRHTKIYDSIAKKEFMVDEWQMLRTLDLQSPAFDSSFTAKMWYQLETGTEYHQISNSDLTQQFLQDYMAKYKPIALPTIIKEPPAQATTNAVSNVTTTK